MDKLDIKKINILLLEKDKTQKELSTCIGLKESSLSQALNNKRPFPFGYIFKIADFFELDDPYVLVESISNEQNKNEYLK